MLALLSVGRFIEKATFKYAAELEVHSKYTVSTSHTVSTQQVLIRKEKTMGCTVSRQSE